MSSSAPEDLELGEPMSEQPHEAGDANVFTSLRTWLDNTFSKEAQKSIATWSRRILLAGVFGLLIYQLSTIGWASVLQAIPTQPLFYLIFVGMYLGLPLAETLIYHLIWGLPGRQIFPMMIRKRVFNKDVVNYSGEANLFLWAKKRLDRPGRLILRDIKDNTVISSLTSMFMALGLLSTFLFSGMLPMEVLTDRLETSWIIGGVFCLVLLIALAIRFRKSVIAFPGKLVARLFGIHVGRLVFVQTLQVLQWIVVMPEVSISVWIMLLSTQIIANQIPLIPSKELLVIVASVELAEWFEVSEAEISGMLLVMFVLDKVVNFVLFSYLSVRKEEELDAKSDETA